MDAFALTSRLRDLVGAPRVPAASGRQPAQRPLTQVADELGGQVCQLDDGCCVVVDRRYAPETTHGNATIGWCADVMQQHLAHLAVLGPSSWIQRGQVDASVRFFDLETTGLAGGAGTYAFLVGFGVFEAGAFHTRQFFLTSFGAERPMLEAVGQSLSKAEILVSFNGRTFDAPLLETRYLFHRLGVPFADAAHLDLLHAARRLWDRDAGCSLRVMEHTRAAVVRHGDIPGADIPARYLHYARTGETELLQPVFEHNRLDLLSLAVLTAIAVRLVEEGAQGTCDRRECLGLGRLLERAGLTDRAVACYARAAAGGERRGGDVRIEALRRLARRMRREGRHRDAADAWEQILYAGAEEHSALREAAQGLAVHYEHRAKDLEAARAFATRALVTAASATRRADARYRLTRLDRKLRAKDGRANVLFDG